MIVAGSPLNGDVCQDELLSGQLGDAVGDEGSSARSSFPTASRPYTDDVEATTNRRTRARSAASIRRFVARMLQDVYSSRSVQLRIRPAIAPRG